MPSNDVFFADQSEQSAVKAHIVSSYFFRMVACYTKVEHTYGVYRLVLRPGQI